jgi:anti-sigma B factor antagonist
MELRIDKVAAAITRATPVGRWDIKGAAEIDLRLSAITATSGSIIIDLAEVTYLASMGMRAIVMGAKAASNRGGKLVLLSPVPAVEEVLTIAGIDQVVPIYHDLNAATLAFGD